MSRRVKEFDGVYYEPGKIYKVLKDCQAIGWVSTSGYARKRTKVSLQPGDEIVCLGFGSGLGSDPGYGVEWEIPGNKDLKHVTLYPKAGGIWDYRPEPGLVRPI
jgi:hypothetical protein